MSISRLTQRVILTALAATFVAAPSAFAHGGHRHKAKVCVVRKPARPAVRASVKVGPVRVTVPARRVHVRRPVVVRYQVHRHRHDAYACHQDHPAYYYDWRHQNCRYLGDDFFESDDFGIHYHLYD